MADKWKWGDGPSTETASANSGEQPLAEVYPPGVPLPLDSTSGVSAPDYVRKARNEMGMLARWQFDKDTKKELQRVAGNIAVNYLSAQKDVMLAKIVAGVGIAKREIFKDFLSRAIEQDKDLVERTNRAQKEIVNMIEKEVLVVLEEKKTKFDEAKAKFDSGKLMEKDYVALCSAYDHAAHKLITDKFERMDKIAQSYLEHFDHAIKIYREKVIQMGGVIS